MSFERRISLVLDYPGSIVAERSEGLALILRRLLAHSKEAFVLERGIHDHALARGVPEPVYRNVVSLLLPNVAHRHTDSVPRVVEANVSPTDETATELADLFTTLDAPAMRHSRAAMLVDLLYSDLDAGNYSMVIRALVESVEQSTAAGQADTVLRTLEEFVAQRLELGAHTFGRKSVLESALQRCATDETIALLRQELSRRPAHRRTEIVRLFGWLGERGRKALVDLARRSFEARTRPRWKCSPSATRRSSRISASCCPDLPLPDLNVALRTLLQLDHPLLSNQIRALTVHTNPQVRRTLCAPSGRLRAGPAPAW